MNQAADVAKAPESEAPKPEMTYANLCAAIGERHYLVAKLSSEIAALTKQIDAIKAKTPEPNT